MADVPPGLILQWLTEPSMVNARTRRQLLSCWRDVSNAGGAVGFPFLPVEDAQVLPAVDAMVDSLNPLVNRLLLATRGRIAGRLAALGWQHGEGHGSLGAGAESADRHRSPRDGHRPEHDD